MKSEDKHVNLSPTFLKVIDQFITTLRANDGMEGNAIDRLENLFKQETIPKPDEIDEALFEPPSNDET